VRIGAGVVLAIRVLSVAGTLSLGARKAMARDATDSIVRGSILFHRGSGAFYAVNADGGQLKLVLPNAALARWSPDGKMLVFVRQEGNGNATLSGLASMSCGRTGNRSGG
jgi:hypothetical protein